MSNSLIILKEIHNLQEVIDDCLDDLPTTTPMVEDLKDKYFAALGMMQKSVHPQLCMGKVLAYKELLREYGVKV